jgi:hypothetical protein
MGEERGVHRVLVGKPEGKRPLGRIILRWIFRYLEEVGGLDGVGSGYEQVVGTCGYGKQPSGSIKMRGIS